jgi:hypothetical protein
MLTVVTGPPCGGKSTYVREHAKRGDLVIDLDRIASSIAYDEETRHDYPQHVRKIALDMRQAAVSAIASQVCDVWLIDSRPSSKSLARYERLGANIVTCDPGLDTVTSRCEALRPAESLEVARRWYLNPRNVASERAHYGSPGRDW